MRETPTTFPSQPGPGSALQSPLLRRPSRDLPVSEGTASRSAQDLLMSRFLALTGHLTFIVATNQSLSSEGTPGSLVVVLEVATRLPYPHSAPAAGFISRCVGA